MDCLLLFRCHEGVWEDSGVTDVTNVSTCVSRFVYKSIYKRIFIYCNPIIKALKLALTISHAKLRKHNILNFYL